MFAGWPNGKHLGRCARWQGDPIIGSYSRAISIKTSANLTASLKTLNSSADAEELRLYWTSPLTVPSEAAAHVAAIASKSLKKTVSIRPSSGIVYFPIEPNTANVAPGPVAIAPDRKSVYFAINDNTGCSVAPGTCKGKIERFDLASQTFSSVPLKSVPGISQLFFSSDGALWMASFAPIGTVAGIISYRCFGCRAEVFRRPRLYRAAMAKPRDLRSSPRERSGSAGAAERIAYKTTAGLRSLSKRL